MFSSGYFVAKKTMTPIEKESTPPQSVFFVGPYIPFVCQIRPNEEPIVGRKIPLVCSSKHFGFTLIELIVTLTIAAILLTIAGPSMSRFIQGNRLTSAANELIGDLALARSEALKRGTNTGVCKSGGGATCAGSGTSWESGWVVFVDVDQDRTWTASDILLRTREPLPPGTAVTVSTGSDSSIIYGQQGQALQGIDTYIFCNATIGRTRNIELITTGRSRMIEGSC